MTGTTDPTRRHVLRAGGLALAFGAVVSACSSDDGPDPAADPGREAPTEEPGRDVTDVALLNTALSLEILAYDLYQVALDGALLERSEVAEALTLFQQHHAEHRDALVAAVEAAEGEPFTTANPVVKVAMVDPGLSSVTAERDFVRLAHDLEHTCAQLYVHAATILETPERRSAVMAIGGVAGRRATVLDLLGDLGNERVARYATTNPLPSDAVVTG